MSKFERIKNEWLKIFKENQESEGFKRIFNRDITTEHYASIMRQIFHHARENPQIQTLATVYFRGSQRDSIKGFYKHAISEIGHDQLALNDIEAMGYNTKGIPSEKPLLATTALLGYAFYQIEHQNPVGYLGYLFHLEFMPTHAGKAYLEAFKSVGVPDEAMSFIHDHATIDIGHNKLMENYIDELVQTEEDFQDVIYAMKVTAKLYADMVLESLESVDQMMFPHFEEGVWDYAEPLR